MLGAPRAPVIAAVAASAVLAVLLHRPLGWLAQRYLTVSTEFSRACVTHIVHAPTYDRHARYLVKVHVEP